MKILKLNHCVLLGIILTAVSCGGGGGGGGGSVRAPEGPSDPEAEEEASEDGRITFDELRQTILTPKCVRCHSEFSQEDGVRPQISPGDPEGSKMFQLVRSGVMPQQGTQLTSQQLEIMRTYIEGAAITNDDIAENEAE